ncbi:MAG: Fur family transcriptional regulator [Pseudochelatococcus sp.]|uniref:Fur family transcriptional regulator n=1 Tax=Pseudochelatococcus sp. TaxID=2020869 RepID=UPI003D925784
MTTMNATGKKNAAMTGSPRRAPRPRLSDARPPATDAPMLLVPDDMLKRLRAARDRHSLTRADIADLPRTAGLLYRHGHRHVTADDLHRDAIGAGGPLLLATVYNALDRFSDAGLLRCVRVDGKRTWFYTDTGDHQHFHFEAERRIADVPPGRKRRNGELRLRYNPLN